MGSDPYNRMRQFFLTGKFPELPGAVNAETLRAAYGEPADIMTDRNSSYYLCEQAEYPVYDASPTQLLCAWISQCYAAADFQCAHSISVCRRIR